MKCGINAKGKLYWYFGTSNTLNIGEKANQDIVVLMHWTETTGFEL